MVKRADQRAGAGAAQGDNGLGVTADEAERLAEQFTPMWEQEPAEEDEPPAEAAKPAAPARVEAKKTAIGVGSPVPGKEAAAPAAKKTRAKPPPKPARHDVPAGKKTVIGLAPPPKPKPEPAAPTEPASSEDIDVDIDTTEVEAAAAAEKPARTQAPKPVAPRKPARQPAKAAGPALPDELAATLKAPQPDALANAEPAYSPVPQKNRKVVIAVMGVAAVILLLVGIKLLFGRSNASQNSATRSNAVPAKAAQTKVEQPPATAVEQPTGTAAPPAAAEQPTAAEQPAKTAAPAATEQPAKTPAPAKPRRIVKRRVAHAAAVKKTTVHKTAHRTTRAVKRYKPVRNSSSGSIVRQTPF